MDGFLGFRVFEWSGGVTDERRGEAGFVMMWKVGLRLVCCSTSGRDVCKFYFSGRWVPSFIIRKCAWGNWKAVFESDRHDGLNLTPFIRVSLGRKVSQPQPPVESLVLS